MSMTPATYDIRRTVACQAQRTPRRTARCTCIRTCRPCSRRCSRISLMCIVRRGSLVCPVSLDFFFFHRFWEDLSLYFYISVPCMSALYLNPHFYSRARSLGLIRSFAHAPSRFLIRSYAFSFPRSIHPILLSLIILILIHTVLSRLDLNH